jgi:hypothetical protein
MSYSWQHRCLVIAIAVTALLASSCAASVAQEPGFEPRAMEQPPSPPTSDPVVPPPPLPKVESALPRTCTMFVKPGILGRAELVRLINAGLPRWMQGVEGDRALANHRFQGWLIKSLYPGDPCYQDIDLRPGDVVQKVNGKSIEKPEQAFDVAEALKTAPAIVVDFLREGKPQRITIAIANE